MVQSIIPIDAETKLAQLLNDGDFLAQATGPSADTTSVNLNAQPSPVSSSGMKGNMFEDILSKAIDSLNSVSQSERYADQMINKYRNREADLYEVMTAQAKASVMVQFATTVVNSAVTSFKEVTQMQV